VFAVTGNLADAEDAVQEAFARASVHWGRTGAYDSPEAWVRRVGLNLAFAGLRRARRLLKVLSRTAAPATVPSLPADSPVLVEALKALPLPFRQMVV
jgi:RNA polymerase sigma-70 factor, ECF subfamily